MKTKSFWLHYAYKQAMPNGSKHMLGRTESLPTSIINHIKSPHHPLRHATLSLPPISPSPPPPHHHLSPQPYTKMNNPNGRQNNKRKFVSDDQHKDTLTLNKARVNSNSFTSLKRCRSIQSTSSDFYSRTHVSPSLKRCRSIQSTSSDFYPRTEVSRKWSYSSLDFSGFEERFVVVSYNILGVENALKHPDLYRGISSEHLDWDHRKTVICKELAQYNPSVLCFQEVDRFSDLQCILHQDGFKGVLKARTGDACDGCAIFWNRESFVLLHEEHIDFQSFGLRHNVAQFCVLKTADSCRSFLVGNIHVLYNPRRGDIKLGQIRLFLEKAYKLSQEWGDIPVVLAGDLNSYPKSAVYQYVSSGKLEMLQHNRRNISGQIGISHGQTPLVHDWNDEELKNATGSGGVTCLQHNLKLHSAYLGVPRNITTRDDIGEPSGTTCHSECTGTVDYIWHTKKLVPFRVLETLPKNVLEKMGGLPSEKWGSDHLALVCDFAFVDEESTEQQLI